MDCIDFAGLACRGLLIFAPSLPLVRSEVAMLGPSAADPSAWIHGMPDEEGR